MMHNKDFYILLDSPPPGYSTTETRIPLPMGPELPRPSLPMPPQPIIVRKSRGYKGILLVMLSVFLMAIFALVLSEMAYSRQRDENFFKLRWAELKQRFGYENDGNVDYYSQAANAIGDKLLSLTKSNEIQIPRVPQSASLEEETTSSSTTQDTPVVAIDTFPMAPSKIGNSDSASRSSQTSDEVEPPHPLFGSSSLNGALSQIRDARLKFLRNILQKIKQHAEDIVEVEPQNSDSSSTSNEDNNNNNNNLLSNGNWPSSIFQRPQQQVLQFPSSSAHFFPHPRPLVEDFKNSRSFLDGFGEIHQPSSSLFMQNNQIGDQEEQQRPRFFSPWALQNELPSSHQIMPSGGMQQQQQQQIPSFIDKL
uniref:Col_cuticle_N domain-containing protein n=1 Tax=Meloidogyne hapla TaxID=6305 RepID=A0A1I8B4J7_MELHA